MLGCHHMPFKIPREAYMSYTAVYSWTWSHYLVYGFFGFLIYGLLSLG